MRIEGRRVQVAGSADSSTDAHLLSYAHELIDQLVRSLAAEGANFVVGVGKEPLAEAGTLHPISTIFDYTALMALSDCLSAGTARAYGDQGRLISVVATSKTEDQIPEHRRVLWEELQKSDAVRKDFVDAGWVSGAVRRTKQAQLGDVLVALSGGEGVEHLAQLYTTAGKPVIPLDLQLGSSTADGSGGAARLAGKALHNPFEFARFSDPDAAGYLLSNTSTRGGKRPVKEVVDGIIALIHGLASPTAFYVRLLNPKVQEYKQVEQFFRNIVDPVITGFGYDILEMGRGVNEYAWMNEAIFDSLHYSSVVVVDLTGLRSNCFMELGYALGHGQRVIATAMRGTRLPFDISAFDCHMWASRGKNSKRITDLQEYWQRNIDRPRLVKERRVL